MNPSARHGLFHHRRAFCAAFVVALAAAAADAAEPASASLGMGMHAFHGGDFEAANRLLSEAIDSGTRDPRAYYFRGLAACRCGAGFEAEADFMEGARLEATGRGGWDIGRALERVQGFERVKLERYRARARSMLATEGEASAGRRYIDATPPASDSRLRPVRPEMEGAKRSAPARAAKPRGDDAESEEKPMAADDEPAATPEPAEADDAAKPAPAAGDSKADPFGSDPFGSGAGEPAERKASEAKDALDQKDEQTEREAAAGDGGVVVEKIE
jgi:hypothetical protein